METKTELKAENEGHKQKRAEVLTVHIEVKRGKNQILTHNC